MRQEIIDAIIRSANYTDVQDGDIYAEIMVINTAHAILKAIGRESEIPDE